MAVAPRFQVIGKPIPRVEGPDKVSGHAVYAADVALSHTLWAQNVRSPHPHARIVSIDASRALAVGGVRVVVTASDLPNKRTGRNLKDLPLLSDGVVRYVGDKVAVVAADSPEAAEEGALSVTVEYEELPAVFDPLQAMQTSAPVIHPNVHSYAGFFSGIPPHIPNVCGYRVHERGDVAAGFAAADLMVEHTFSTHLTHQGYLEPHACVVEMGADGRAEVWPSHKLPYILREQLAELIDRPESDIVIHPITVGADFGAKGAPADVPVAYHLARMTGRPVKFVASSHVDLVGLSHRHPSVVTIRTGLQRDGRILARSVRVIYNTGAYGALKPSEDGMLTGADYAAGPYRIPNVHVEAFCVYTNQPPCGYMRAPGHPQVAFAVEAHTDLLARELGIDPLEFRLRNVVRESPLGGEALAPRVLQTAAEAIGWPAPKAALVGRGMAIVERGIGFGEGTSDVTLNRDGTITVLSGLPDNGTGALTVVSQIVAEEFGVSMDQVHLVRGTTDALPTDVGSAADRMTNVAGHAAIAASEKVKEQLAPLAASMLGAEAAEWDGGGWRPAGARSRGERVSLEELAMEMVTPGEPAAHAQVTLAQARSPDRAYCVQAAEVEVDPETGQVHLRRVASVQDTGTIINPIGHQGQIEGGLVQGIGYALTEEMVLEEGRIVGAHLGEYKLPATKDIPPLITVNIPSIGPGPFHAKGIGEMPCVPSAAAIANAVADAIGAPVFQLPITAERVLAAMGAKPHSEAGLLT